MAPCVIHLYVSAGWASFAGGLRRFCWRKGQICQVRQKLCIFFNINHTLASDFKFRNTKDQWLDLAEFPKDQTQMYVGPLDDRTSQADLQAQFVQFGAIRVNRDTFFNLV